jgi:NAD(P)-dependent dehydrogenase (short-subunit alcohol dehydrogenase family)
LLLAAPGARVVTVTSSAHHFGRALRPSGEVRRRGYSAWGAYGDSKLANYHFAIGLQRHFEQSGARAVSLLAHPGLSNTNLQAHTVEEGGGGVVGDFFLALVRRIGMSAEGGALSQIRAATDPRKKGGQFLAPRWFTAGPPVVRPIVRPGNRKAITRLWALSEQATGLSLQG